LRDGEYCCYRREKEKDVVFVHKMVREMMWKIKQTSPFTCLIQLVKPKRERGVWAKNGRETCGARERKLKLWDERQQAYNKRWRSKNTPLQNFFTSIPKEEYVGFCDDLTYFFFRISGHKFLGKVKFWVSFFTYAINKIKKPTRLKIKKVKVLPSLMRI
jgi:hypothetical protein